jgi:glycosyltransferase involved in cell wall biosynthesis
MYCTNDPLVTIAIPFYNSEKFLHWSIQSVLNQTYSNWELLLLDDGSTDNSLAIAQKFISDSRIRIISDNMNKGIASRLNQSIDIAKGSLFARMDSDDIMFPNRIEEQVSFMNQNPSIDVVGSSAIIIDNKNRITGYREVKFHNSFQSVLRRGPFIHPTVFGRIEWFRKYYYADELSGVEDYELWLRSFNYSNFFNIKMPLLFYRDPLSFKLKTYLFRKKQARKIYIDYIKRMPDYKFLFIKLLILSFLKSIASSIFDKLKIEKFFVMRRNKKIDLTIYNKILLEIIYDKKNE